MRLKGVFRTLTRMTKRNHGHTATGAGSVQLNVPFVHQNHINMCGDASVNMALKSHGKDFDAPVKESVGHGGDVRLRRNPRGVLEGLTTDDVIDRLKAKGLEPISLDPSSTRNITAAELKGWLNEHGPLIIKGPSHFMIITGVDGNSVFYHDPWRGKNMRMSLDALNHGLEWNDPDRVIGVQRN